MEFITVPTLYCKSKNITIMKKLKISLLGLGAVAAIGLAVLPVNSDTQAKEPKGCVFRTLFGEEESDSAFVYKTTEKVIGSMDKGLAWIEKAQQKDGGWGCGSHSRQDIMDPNAVKTDPATTSMVAMALQRTGSTLTTGEHSEQLRNGLNYLLNAVEEAKPEANNITTQTGTQIQSKLGANIDVILTAQFLTNILDLTAADEKLHARTKKCLDICVEKIQRSQDSNGSFKGGSWAGVLQSSLANNALESAQAKGVKVDEKVLEKSRDYQKGNINTTNGSVKTDMGAGVVLYSVSSTGRASAKEARIVREELNKAKREGRIDKDAEVTAENLEKIGYNKTDAMKASTSYEVYRSANTQAQDNRVMTGFGNNGGEEFLSYLQTGESMIIGKDTGWKKWYDNITGRMVSIQNNDGSWNGHHCISSPVFCTATCLLILSVNNDTERLMAIGKK